MLIRYKYLFISLIFSVCFYTSCKNKKEENLTKTPVFKEEAGLSIVRGDSTLIQLNIELAQTEYEIQTGLMYRPSMLNNQGMLFIFPEAAPRAFYMKNTLMPLDIIFFDEDSTLVSIQHNAKPFNEASLPSEAPAQFVLEINAGLSKAWQLQKGDKIYWQEN